MPEQFQPSDQILKFRATLTPENQELFDYVYQFDGDQARRFIGFALSQWGAGNRGDFFALLKTFKKHFSVD